MTGSGDKSSTAFGARWILILALLAVGVGLLLLKVADGGDARKDGARISRSQEKRSMRVGQGGGRPEGPGGRGPASRGVPDRVDRARLARLLRQGSAGGGEPGGGTDAARGPDRAGGSPGGDGQGAPEDTTVWPLTAKGIRGAIRARIEEIKECYDGWLADDDELGGKLILAFTIEKDADGELARISNAEIQQSSLDHPGLERCVLVMAESLSFEPPAGDKVTVRYPFRFKPRAD